MDFNRFEFRVFLDKAEEPSLSYYLPIAGGRIIGFIPFPRVLVLCEMLSASSRICPFPTTITITPQAPSIVFDTFLLNTHIRYISSVKWSNPRKGAAPFPTARHSSYWEENLWATLDYARQLLISQSDNLSIFFIKDRLV